MPELPEVERLRGLLAEHCAGQRVESVRVIDTSVLRNASPVEFTQTVSGSTLAEPCRRGKWLVAPTDGPVILFHFGMTGELCWNRASDEVHRYDRLIFRFEAGELRYRDQWKLRGIWLAGTAAEVDDMLRGLGPDALTISAEELRLRLGRRARGLKAGLMDQALVAGLGNMLIDEVLWRARLHPESRTTGLSGSDWGRLHRTLRQVLQDAVPAGHVPLDPGWLSGNRHPGAPCPRCGAPLLRSRVNGRTTYWCPRCQPRASIEGVTPGRPHIPASRSSVS